MGTGCPLLGAVHQQRYEKFNGKTIAKTGDLGNCLHELKRGKALVSEKIYVLKQ